MAGSKLDYDNVLSGIPDSLREPLLNAFNEILTNYVERRWEPSELNGGKICEVIYTILYGLVSGSYPSKPSKPRNFLVACKKLADADKALYRRSIRIQIPRMLIALYEFRSNRGVAHTGGDVDPNQMDAACVVSMSKWLVAELIRIFHQVDTKTATDGVEAVTERIIPVVWKVDDKLRVLDTSLNVKDRVLILLYHCSQSCGVEELREWAEYSNTTHFKTKILTPLHKAKMVEFDSKKMTVTLSPSGIKRAEEILGDVLN